MVPRRQHQEPYDRKIGLPAGKTLYLRSPKGPVAEWLGELCKSSYSGSNPLGTPKTSVR